MNIWNKINGKLKCGDVIRIDLSEINSIDYYLVSYQANVNMYCLVSLKTGKSSIHRGSLIEIEDFLGMYNWKLENAELNILD